MVHEVLERRIRGLGALQKMLMVYQEDRLPGLPLLPANQRKGIQRNIVMGRTATVRTNDTLEQGHGRDSSAWQIVRPRSALTWLPGC